MSKLQKYNLLELPWTDVADYLKAGNDAVMIPVGSCEKHGHHVPLGVDSYTTMGNVERAALKAKVLYAPLLPFGVSPHHMGEPGWGTGTISFPTEVYRDVLYAEAEASAEDLHQASPFDNLAYSLEATKAL